MSAAFLKAGLGVWMKKPIEQDQFVLDVNMWNSLKIVDILSSIYRSINIYTRKTKTKKKRRKPVVTFFSFIIKPCSVISNQV